MPNQDLDEKVRFLASPGALAGPEVAAARETHMSWVFLTNDLVFKLKKPVKFSYLDFSSLEAREAACREELSLNRRLAPEIYLRLARLTRERDGAFKLDGQGRTIDWLVVMRRLPDEQMLDARILAGRLGRKEIEDLAAVLADFYAQAPPAPVTAEAYLARLRAQLALDRTVLCEPRPAFDHARAASMLDRLEAWRAALEPALRARVEQGGLVEGHGDLRPEHVCLGEPVRIIDRLEFNRDLRLIDPFDELAFLGLECAMLGARWIGPVLIERAALKLAPPPAELMSFYAALRASLRARLSLAHLLDAKPRQPETWAPRATRYLLEAESALSLHRPVIG
jgi:aminoglycoside phosphotransferase family enzyme